MASSSQLGRWIAASSLALASAFAWAPSARAQSCTSSDPSQWPAPSRPYFMIVVDTSGSMILPVSSAPSCTGYPSTRMGHAKCSVKNTVLAFGGEVNFGLAQYAGYMNNCGANCYGNASGTPNPACGVNCFQAEINTTGTCGACGPMDNVANAATRHGANILVPMQIDNTWTMPTPAPASNNFSILQYVDNNCTNSLELTNPPIDGPQYGKTPINGALRDMKRYFQTGWTNPDDATISYTTPLNTQDRPCRSVNVILLTDGDETCDTQADAVNAAASLLTGVTVGGNTFSIKTYVINFAGGNQTNTDAIAAAGGTTSSYFATNETQLSQALASIVGGSIKPETCNNTDDNCNGCVDEGFVHYCNQQNLTGCCTWKTPAQKTACGANACACCNWTNAAERTTCLNNYTATITAANPKGDLTLLPCTTQAQSQASATWLCYDPGDACDNLDNNCVSGVDEGATKCGSPLHCPQAETCNGQDDNCNGLVDEGNVCVNQCAVTASAEVCDGCDNDCDGMTDNGISVSLPCGFSGPGEPAYCQGTITCKAPVAVPKGTCSTNGGFSACTFPAPGPSAEVCDGLDNDCNGVVDDNITGVACVPNGTPGNLVYGGNSQCKKGTTQCINGTTQCVGFVGPSAEVCDGVDNNCDGTVDNGAVGAGQPCGVNLPPCTSGTTACVNGALVCQGGSQPKPETCNGVDDDCNGQIDDGALADAPAAGMNGCWTDAGTCCHFPAVNPTLHWCPPPGATCTDNGSLTAPCNHGTLTCTGGAWQCKGPKEPVAEVCDGIDNNCNGVVDDGVMNVGTVCGSSVGECKQGILQCNAGILSCVGGVFPTAELCDGKDNDCDGTVDNGIPTGGPCTMPYDTSLYPGPRDSLPCKPGVYQCDGNGGLVCAGGVGPSPEVCDGLDNDCDGMIDEVGNAPDGINGSDNPFPPPAAKIGDACGVDQGECKQGAYTCLNGQFACVGGQGKHDEECDCTDNDCDGTVDNQTPGGAPICSPGKDCIKSTFGCGCATPCDLTKEFPCPGGQVCQDVTSSQTGMPAGKYCVSDPCGGDCTGKTVTDANNKVICAPPGTAADPATCVAPPVCVCKGQNGCKDPCSGVSCGPGTVCAEYGPSAGKCVADNCYVNPCQGCGKVCNLGSCVANPCEPNPCQSDEECKPSSDFTTQTCVPSCATVQCASDQECVAGQCVPTCNPACPNGQTCDRSQTPPTCVTDKCNPNPCTDGSFCDPVTGSCGNDPCAGVACPTGEVCKQGSCFAGQGGTGGASGSSSSGGTTSSSGAGTGGGAGGGEQKGIWGLATGGGGCSCEVGPGIAERFADARWALAALGLVIGMRRRSRANRATS
ncbi:MAG: MopE-related protein [Minicystis sp.]